uniref:Cation efflux protein cytoplasmic domain-containing protein n=1 Tax=Tetranychus urticae TaxID=32264 RepID=T1L0U7_TETUR
MLSSLARVVIRLSAFSSFGKCERMATELIQLTWPLLSESAMILLQTVPTHIEVEDLLETLTKEIKGALAVHEFHVWQLTGDLIIASAHIQVQNLQDYMRIAEKVKEFFHNVKFSFKSAQGA